MSLGGRFGKYGDAKRKAKNLKTRLRPPALQQREKNKPVSGSNRSSA